MTKTSHVQKVEGLAQKIARQQVEERFSHEPPGAQRPGDACCVGATSGRGAAARCSDNSTHCDEASRIWASRAAYQAAEEQGGSTTGSARDASEARRTEGNCREADRSKACAEAECTEDRCP
jgi:hypothetical protein